MGASMPEPIRDADLLAELRVVRWVLGVAW